MKKNIHPEYKDVTVKCGCGNTFTTRSTKAGGAIAVEICSSCHPFYTGKQKFVDTAGMVERFQKKWTGDKAKQARDQAAGKKPGAKAAATRTGKTLQSQLPGAGPATLAPDIGQKAQQKFQNPGESKQS